MLEGAVATRWEIQACQDALAPYPLRLIVLAPPAEISDQRDAQRSGKHVAPYFRHLAPLLATELAGAGRWIDNSGQSPLDTVRVILSGRDGAGEGSGPGGQRQEPGRSPGQP